MNFRVASLMMTIDRKGGPHYHAQIDEWYLMNFLHLRAYQWWDRVVPTKVPGWKPVFDWMERTGHLERYDQWQRQRDGRLLELSCRSYPLTQTEITAEQAERCGFPVLRKSVTP